MQCVEIGSQGQVVTVVLLLCHALMMKLQQLLEPRVNTAPAFYHSVTRTQVEKDLLSAQRVGDQQLMLKLTTPNMTPSLILIHTHSSCLKSYLINQKMP